MADGTETRRAGRVLLAEDAPANILLFRTVLEREGYTVDVASDGETAADLGAAGGYDLILMDVGLPRLDGVGAARRITRAAVSPPPLILALTAEDDPAVTRACRDAGMADVLQKPIGPRDLVAAVGEAIAVQRAAQRRAG